MAKNRLSPEAAVWVRETERPMRWRKAEAIAQKYMRLVMLEWMEVEEELLGLFPKDDSQRRWVPDPCDAVRVPGCCDEPVTKVFSESQIQALRSRLAAIMGTEFVSKIEGIFTKALNKLWKGRGEPVTEGAIFNEMYAAAYEEGYAEAFRLAQREALRSGPEARATIAGFSEFVNVQAFNPTVQSLYRKGFELVTAKITKQFTPDAFKIIADGLQDGPNWQKIAYQIKNKVGVGAGWHWKRLVRTELSGTFNEVARDRYKEMNVQALKHALVAMGACPICVEINERNPGGSIQGGWYSVSSAPVLPWSTHPQCRCRYLPKFSIPDGIVLNT